MSGHQWTLRELDGFASGQFPRLGGNQGFGDRRRNRSVSLATSHPISQSHTHSNSVIIRVDRKVKEWGSWSQLKSFLSQSEIKDGIDRLYRDIDTAMMKFHVSKLTGSPPLLFLFHCRCRWAWK